MFTFIMVFMTDLTLRELYDETRGVRLLSLRGEC